MVRYLSVAVSACLVAQSAAFAITTNWLGKTPSWSVVTNWSNGLPGPEDTAVFTGGASISIPSGGFAKEIVFTPFQTGFVAINLGLAGQKLTLSDGGSVRLTSGVVFEQSVIADLILGDAGSSSHTFSTYWRWGAPLQFEGAISGGTNGPAGVKSLIIDTGDIRLLGPVGDGGADALTITVQNGAALRLSAANTYSGGTTVHNGSFVLGASDVVPDFGDIVLDFASIFLDGHSDTMGALSVLSASTINFSEGSNALCFLDSNSRQWDGVLALQNFNIGDDTLRFGSDSSALTPNQLSLIQLPGYSAALDPEGYVVFSPVPEPSCVVLLGFALAMLLLASRKAFFCATAVTTLVMPCAHSKETTFLRTSPPLDWNVESNWNNGIPTVQDDVKFLQASFFSISLGSGAFAKNIILSSATSSSISLGTNGTQKLTLGNDGSIVITNVNNWGLRVQCALVLGENGEASTYTLKPYAWSANGSLNVSGSISGGVGGQAGEKTIIVETGRVAFTGAISDGGAAALSILIKNGASLDLYGPSTFSGDIKVLGGELVLGPSPYNRVPDDCHVTLGVGQIFAAGGTETFGTLSLVDDSVLDFSRGTGHLSFADSSSLLWEGFLVLFDFLPGEDTLRFGTDSSALSSEQLSQIHVFGYEEIRLDDDGYIQMTAVPEPRTILLLVLGPIALIVFRRMAPRWIGSL